MRLWFGFIFALLVRPAPGAQFGNLPLFFEQQESGSAFLAQSSQGSILVTGQGARIAPAGSPSALIVSVVGGNLEARAEGESPLPGRSNYVLGRDPAKWRTGVAQYGRVRIVDVLPGIDIVYYGKGQILEYDFTVHPGADPARIALRFQGAGKVGINGSGDLDIETSAGKVTQHKPTIWQDGRAVPGEYVLRKNGDFGFALGTYDRARELVIDPVITFSTYLGGAVYDSPNAIAVDSAGNTYIAGSTSSFNFPVTMGAARTAFPSTPAMVAFIAKLNPAGTALVYATYLGGSGVNGGDAANGIAVDAAGNAYVTGTTGSADFPTTAGAFSPALNGAADAFVTKLNPAGSALLYSTYFGGTGLETASAIAVDAGGDAFITGSTGSTDFPVTVGASQSVLRSADDAFVAKFGPTGGTLLYATYLGGSREDVANALVIDAAGNAYVAGSTASPNFPVVPEPTSPAALPGSSAAFAAKLNPAGTALLYSTFLGGSGGDYASAIAVDGTGNVYLAGTTFSGDFPVTPGSFSSTVPGAIGLGHGFVSKLNPNGAVLYATFLGGSNSDAVTGIAVDAAGEAILTGFTYSTNFPVSANPLDVVSGYSPTGFVSKLNPAGSAILYSSFVGASGSTAAQALVLDAAGFAYVTGYTASPNFPTTGGALQLQNGSISGQTGTGFVSKIDLASATVCSLSLSASSLSFPLLGGSASVSVSAPAGCAWEALPANAWLTVSSTPHGVGPGPVTFTAASNEGNLSARSTSVSVGGISVAVTQPAGTCTAPQFFPATQSFGAAGGPGSVAVVLPPSCAFTAVSGSSWIVITSGATGTGDTLLEFTVSPDSGVSRMGTLTIAGSPYTVSQLTSVCGYSVQFPYGQVAPSSGGIFSASLTTSGDCFWAASSNALWLLVTSPVSAGSGPVFFQALANNTGAARSATATIAGEPYIIWQYVDGSQSTVRGHGESGSRSAARDRSWFRSNFAGTGQNRF